MLVQVVLGLLVLGLSLKQVFLSSLFGITSVENDHKFRAIPLQVSLWLDKLLANLAFRALLLFFRLNLDRDRRLLNLFRLLKTQLLDLFTIFLELFSHIVHNAVFKCASFRLLLPWRLLDLTFILI